MLSNKLLFYCSKPVVLSYTGVMLKMDVQKHKPFPQGAKIIAVNHPSTTDPFFIASMLRQQSFILITELLFQVPLLGAYLRRAGHIPVQAGKGKEAIDRAVELLKRGRTVVIFPEGGISPLEGGFHRARTGVARIALMSKAPVIPVGIHLERKRLHATCSTVRGQVEYGYWYARGPYNITTGAPLYFSGSVDDHAHVRLVADRIMHHIIELAHKSKERLDRASGTLVYEGI
ncbi:MAG TPA: lysophospholipid acyltransferase family protein [Levilinea sp.]|nr:lysophospholipid acyltransferase family protein [Levilinea sp.]